MISRTRSPARATEADKAGLRKAGFSKEAALLDSLSASAELERIFEWGEALNGPDKALGPLSSIRHEDLGRRVPGSKATIRDLLYFVAEATASERVRSAANALLEGGA
jgi:hypothetical protein